jgi:murein DD-endopeptidase MepM/ murein hydrolase activator NlpD
MGGLGNAVKIRHSSGYQSVYGHLSRISPVSRAGARVKQGMVIGFVGSTGISTGPHLHFSLLVNGKYINPQKRVAPPTEPIPARSLAAFRESIRPWLAKLDELRAPGRKEPA